MSSKKFISAIRRLINIFFKKKPTPAQYREKIVKNVSRNGVKDCFTGDDSLSLSNKQKFISAGINKKARSIIKSAVESPEVLLAFIESKGTVIVKSKFMGKILRLFGEQEGFLTPMKGIKALLFTIIINIFSLNKLEIGLKTPAMFALNDKPVNIYTLSHQFHLWLSYINKLPGFEEKTMKNFKNFWEEGPNSQDVSYLSVEEILSLQDIIDREKEALDFVKEMAREFVGQKSSLKKLREGKSISL